MTKTIHGKVRGRTIVFDGDVGLTDGQEVEVSLRTITNGHAQSTGGGILRTEGALVEDPYWDSIMDEIYQTRKQERPGMAEEP